MTFSRPRAPLENPDERLHRRQIAEVANAALGGSIVESGSNEDGEYVRYADGTQICWNVLEYTDSDFQLTPGDTEDLGDIPFPAQFVGGFPSLSASCGVSSASLDRRTTIDVYVVGSSNSSWRRLTIRHNGQSSSSLPSAGDPLLVHLTAHGRWR